MSCPPGPQQQTHRTLLQRANGTNGRTPRYAYIPSTACYAGSANNGHSGVDKPIIVTRANAPYFDLLLIRGHLLLLLLLCNNG